MMIAAHEIPFMPAPGYINDETVLKWAERLWRSPGLLRYLGEARGIDFDTVVTFDLGWDGSRITIPIRDWYGRVVNVRRYLPHAAGGQPKIISYATGSGEARLYPIANIRWRHDEPILVCEGEFDALVANQAGSRAVTSTGGAGRFLQAWGHWFKDQEVRIIFDRDDAGAAGARKVAKTIQPFASSVRIIQIPIDRKGADLTDLYLERRRLRCA